ncbi:hypothetical protein B0H10DRAFT_2231260 [Mycena sp. CBHHK59/15]|nr:hypothetical protein B0H10DRAFT_2231260 [Mycena sp. CBHHK59/15]
MKPSTFSLLLSTLAVVSATYLTSDPFPRRGPNHSLFTRQNGTQIPTNLTNAQLETSYQAQCSMANSATGQGLISADIQNATINSIAIDQSFSQIYAKLLVIDSENLDNGTLFAPTWKAINQNWTNILWASRTMASNSAAYCTEFTTVIMPFVANLTGPVPTTISVDLLKSYSDMADDLVAESNATSDAFADIINSITGFTATFSSFAAETGATDQKTIDDLNADIASLRAQIHDLNIAFTVDMVAIGVTVFATVAAIQLFPGSSSEILGAGLLALQIELVGLAVILGLRQTAQSTISDDQKKITTLTDELSQIAQADYTLAGIQNSTSTMDLQLQGFTAIWGAVKSDCTAVAEYLISLDTPETGSIPQVFWAADNEVHCVYESVANALTEYAIGIADSGIPPPTAKRALEDFPAKLHADAQALVAAAWAKANALQEADA